MSEFNAKDRRNIMLQNEGGLIGCAGHHSDEFACAFARAEIDGKVNAMIRLQGAQKTAEYLFAVADRAAGAIKEPTRYALALVESPVQEVAQPHPEERAVGQQPEAVVSTELLRRLLGRGDEPEAAAPSS